MLPNHELTFLCFQDAGTSRLRGKSMGLRCSRWIWRNPKICVQVYGRPGGIGRVAVAGDGVTFDDNVKVSSSTDDEDIGDDNVGGGSARHGPGLMA